MHLLGFKYDNIRLTYERMNEAVSDRLSHHFSECCSEDVIRVLVVLYIDSHRSTCKHVNEPRRCVPTGIISSQLNRNRR
jgi:hypothetical protein